MIALCIKALSTAPADPRRKRFVTPDDVVSVYLNQQAVPVIILTLIAARCYEAAPLNDPAATDELEGDHDDRDYEQGVDQASGSDRAYQAETPKNQKYHCDCVEHDLFPPECYM